ncbi:sulfite exporter TauE/SafE family protein [Hwangdonia lutea]|uniref:sulfite exporter TauE/SafE family protein n=1 Tax=Hwangdonia lutea TaxID=3075823 RepID=UPI0033130480
MVWANIPIKKAAETSLIIVTINSLIGFTGNIQTTEIEWLFLLPFTLISVIGIVIGVLLSKFISSNKLKKVSVFSH